MKTNLLRQSKSFIRTNLLSFLLCAGIIVLLFTVMNQWTSAAIQHAFPSINNLLGYEGALRDDHFADIPRNKFALCDYIFFDENGRSLYTTGDELKNSVSVTDLDFIPDYRSGRYYDICENPDPAAGQRYFVERQYYAENDDTVYLEAYCILDAEYRILEGTLFSERKQLTQQQFELLYGVFKDKKNIERCEYVNGKGQTRTLVFIAPLLNNDTYHAVMKRTNLFWLLFALLAAGTVALQTVFLSGRIRKSIRPLNAAIIAYGNGERLPLENQRFPLEYRGIVESFTKLTARMDKVNDEKEQAFRDRQRMIADISHDLRTPLTVIQGYSQAILDGRVSPEKEKQYIQAIYQKSVLSAAMISTLFEYTHLQHPEYVPNRVPLDLAEFSKEYLAEKYTELEIRGYQLEVQIPDGRIAFSGDGALLTRLYDNLIGNAVKYNTPGTTVFFSLCERLSGIEITVADNGCGLPEGVKSKIFEPFVVGNDARTSGGGTGLGMAIAQSIVRLHGGVIRLCEPPHKGYATEFCIFFPHKEADNDTKSLS